MKVVVWLVAFLSLKSFGSSGCSWCVHGDSKVKETMLKMAALSPQAMLSWVRNQNVCVRILRSGRSVPAKSFKWSDVEGPTGPLSLVTSQSTLMGKTLCANEHPVAYECETIVVADDAPKSTLIHEFLHVLQIRKDKDNGWCATSKALWTTPADKISSDVRRTQLDREWDVHKVLWENIGNLKVALDDQVGIPANLFDQAGARSSYDPTAMDYIKSQKVELYLNAKVEAYKKKLGIKK